MARTLVLALPETGWKSTQACDYVLSADGRSPASHGRAALGLLPAADALVLLVPPSLLSWHRVRLPPLPERRVAAALAGLLEDRLLDDPAQLAFALAPGAAVEDTRLVAVCDRGWLQSAIDGAAERRLRLSRIAPAHPPAATDAQCHIALTTAQDGAIAVRVTRDHVLSLPVEQAAVLWQSAAGASPLPLQVEDGVDADALAAPGSTTQAWSRRDALWQAARSGWELAQFDLAPSRRRPALRALGRALQAVARAPQWRPLRWGLGVLVAAQLVGVSAWAWRLNADLLARREQARALLLQAFPGVRSVVDAPLQMERELALLRRTRGVPTPADADAMLAALASVLPAGEGVRSLRYAAGELSVAGARLDDAAWEPLRARLAAQGYRVQRDGDRLLLRSAGAPG